MSSPSASEILGLYRSLLRYSKTLKLTDKGYFRYRLRDEFRKNSGLTDIKDIKFYFERGQEVLKQQRIV